MTLKLRREHYVRLYLEVNSVLKNQDTGTKILDEFPRPTCRSVYTVSDKRLRHGGSGYETSQGPYPSYAIAITSRDNQNHRTMERRDYDVTKETHNMARSIVSPY